MKEKYIHALLDMAERFGQTSTAQRLKVGCLIYKNDSIISLGINGQPPGWHTEVCEGEDGLTLATVRHAEEAALQKLWNSHETASGATMFISHCPCLSCSIKIVTAGIKSVYYRNSYRNDDGLEYLLKNGVEVVKMEKESEEAASCCPHSREFFVDFPKFGERRKPVVKDAQCSHPRISKECWCSMSEES